MAPCPMSHRRGWGCPPHSDSPPKGTAPLAKVAVKLYRSPGLRLGFADSIAMIGPSLGPTIALSLHRQSTDKRDQDQPMDRKEYTDDIDLQKYWLILKRRWLPATLVFTGTLAAALFYAVSRTPIYNTTGALIFVSNTTPSLTGLGENLGRLDTLFMANNPLDTQAEILTSNTLLNQVITALNLRDEGGNPLHPNNVRENLTVRGVPGTDILHISYTDPDPDLTHKVVNQLMEAYIQYDVATNRTEAASARQFLEQELPTAEAAVNEAAEALRAFKDRNQIVNLEDEAKAAVEVLSVLDNNINGARAELASAQARSQQVAQQIAMDLPMALATNRLTQNPTVQNTLSRLQAVQGELSQSLARYTEAHPIIQNLRSQEATVTEQLRRQVTEVTGLNLEIPATRMQLTTLEQQLIAQWVQTEVDRMSLETRVQSLLETRDRYLEWSLTFPNLERQQQQLVNQLRAAQDTYDRLLIRRQEIQLAENQTVGNARILDYAILPRSAMGSNKKVVLAAGIVGGGLLAVGIAALLDLIDRSVKTVKEAQQTFGLPLLGLIPYYRLPPQPKDGAMVEPSPPLIGPLAEHYPMVSDAYQMLQANLKFVSSDKRLKTFVVTSAVAGEGKTAVASQLALTMAQSGRKVLLLEADMRSPSQHHVWNVLNGIGLSHVLVGEGSLREALQSLSPTLTLMTAGVHPPNPLALIDSEQMAKLLKELAQDYDLVILDTPPLANCADAAILGKIADGVVLVVRPRVLDSTAAAAAKSLLERSNAQVLGLVANGTEVTTTHEDYTPPKSHLPKPPRPTLVNQPWGQRAKALLGLTGSPRSSLLPKRSDPGPG